MIIGITGTIGAGKGTAVEYLVQKYHFTHYSVRDFLNQELARRGLVSSRDNMALVANEIRAQHGPEYITQQLLSGALASGGNAVIESIRSIGEASFLKAQGAHLWAVDSEVRVRYERIVQRGSSTDHISFEKFLEDEQRELANSDPNKQNLSAVIASADVLLHNDDTKEALFAQIDAVLGAGA